MISNIYGRNDMILVPSEKYYGSLGIGKKMDKSIIGLQVDYENRTFTRLESAFGLSAGSDFDKFEMFGGRKRCNVLDDGTRLSKEEGVTLAKAGGINGVAVGVSRKGEEYLRSLPDQNENNNLSSLPTINE